MMIARARRVCRLMLVLAAVFASGATMFGSDGDTAEHLRAVAASATQTEISFEGMCWRASTSVDRRAVSPLPRRGGWLLPSTAWWRAFA